MTIDASPVVADAVRPLRGQYRREMNCQIVHDSWLDRRWVDPYSLTVDGATAGYGLVGSVRAENNVNLIEFFVLPEFRFAARRLFGALIAASGATEFELQTNDRLATLMAYDFAATMESNVVLFDDAFTSRLAPARAVFRKYAATDAGRVLGRTVDEVDEWVVEVDGQIVAAGGLLFHYNPPYGDIYMEVAKGHQRRGYGSFLVQELKRTAYEINKVPAARCNASNVGSRACLEKAGMLPCARVLAGALSPP